MLHRNKLTTAGEPSTCILHQYRITLLRQDAWVQVTVIPQAWGCSKDFISLPFPVWFQPSFLRYDFLVSGSYWKEMLIMKPHPFSQKQEKTCWETVPLIFLDIFGRSLFHVARRHFSTTNPNTMHLFLRGNLNKLTIRFVSRLDPSKNGSHLKTGPWGEGRDFTKRPKVLWPISALRP